MNNSPQRATEHRRYPGEVEITRFELDRIYADKPGWVEILETSIFCTCPVPAKRLVAYKVYVNDLLDVVLRGSCSACGHLAVRYAETGEVPELTARVKAVLAERKKGTA